MRRGSQALRLVLISLLLTAASVPLLAPGASGAESLKELQARQDSLQAELNAAQAKIEELRTEQDNLERRIEHAGERIRVLRKRETRLRSQVVARARELYMNGNSEMLEALFGGADISELMTRTEVLSQLSLDNSGVFVDLSRSQAELAKLEETLADDQEALTAAQERLADENDLLQAKFESVSAEYERLKAALMRQAQAPAPAAPVRVASAPAPPRPTGGMTCPVAGATSFVDSWGAPRAGHTHQGVDMMGAYGTPLVAITSGTITLSSYGGSAGYWQILSGDDGHQYWYMHNERNIVNGGHVSVGQQIATLGDTGNAAGTPHLHFEYHPGGGAAINPYPLVASLC